MLGHESLVFIDFTYSKHFKLHVSSVFTYFMHSIQFYILYIYVHAYIQLLLFLFMKPCISSHLI